MTYYSKQSLRQKSEIFATSLYTKEAFVMGSLWIISSFKLTDKL